MAVRICHIKLNGSKDEAVPVGLGLKRNKIGCYSAVNGAFGLLRTDPASIPGHELSMKEDIARAVPGKIANAGDRSIAGVRA